MQWQVQTMYNASYGLSVAGPKPRAALSSIAQTHTSVLVVLVTSFERSGPPNVWHVALNIALAGEHLGSPGP